MLDRGSINLQFMFPFPTDFVKVLEEKMLPHVGRRDQPIAKDWDTVCNTCLIVKFVESWLLLYQTTEIIASIHCVSYTDNSKSTTQQLGVEIKQKKQYRSPLSISFFALNQI